MTTIAGGGRAVAQVSTPIVTMQEAPILAEQVAARTLPAVADRLPVNPLVVQPHEAIGTYGGTWHTALVGGSDNAWLIRTIGYDHLVRWDPEWTEIIPNIAESFEANEDATRFTFTLREGTRWSDGAPFTVDDVVFYVEDVYNSPDIGVGLGTNKQSIEVVDELTFTIVLEKPDGLFLIKLASPSGRDWTRYPKHYLSQFLPQYNTTNLDQLVADAGVADWKELFRSKGGSIPGTPYDATWQNVELPNLLPFVLVEPYATGTRALLQRNPYYWKVDPEGNQLPYLDEVQYEILQDAEVLLLKASAGEIDMHFRHINTNVNKPVLSDAQESGGFTLYPTNRGDMNDVMISLNMTHKDPAMREILGNHDFRAALSLAINRQEIIDTVYVSQGESWQGAPKAETPFFNELLAKQYTEFDVDQANAMLDAILPNRDGDGNRLRADGEPLVVLVEVSAEGVSAPVDQMNMVVGYWQAVGVNAQLNPIDRSLLYTRKEANDHDCVVWYGNGGSRYGAFVDPRWYFPHNIEANYAIPWALWFTKAENQQAQAEEPPEATKQQMDLYRQIEGTADPEEQNALFAQILQIAQEQFYAIGIILPGPGYGLVKNTFRNVPQNMPEEWTYPNPAPTNPEQYFIQQ
jgi:peptide/nickel transport system substrate-binding protein